MTADLAEAVRRLRRMARGDDLAVQIDAFQQFVWATFPDDSQDPSIRRLYDLAYDLNETYVGVAKGRRTINAARAREQVNAALLDLILRE